MGDGLLAVFPIDEYVGDATHVCTRVLEAAREARASVEALAHPVGDVIERFRFGVALHVGNILYGNIGGGNRLDFTCIGPAVNLAARLEKIAGRLGRTVVVSEGFARICHARLARARRFSDRGVLQGAACVRARRGDARGDGVMQQDSHDRRDSARSRSLTPTPFVPPSTSSPASANTSR